MKINRARRGRKEEGRRKKEEGRRRERVGEGDGERIKLHFTYKRKSCSHAGLAPLTVIVVDLTFCN